MTTYSKLYFQIIFSVKNRNKLIHSSWEDQLYKYIASVLKAKGAKPYIINGMPDHIHIFLGTRPDINISYLVQEIKKASSKFIKENKYYGRVFYWQEGYAVFSYSENSFDKVYNYIKNQKEHHSKFSFEEEYKKILEEHNVNIDPRFFI